MFGGSSELAGRIRAHDWRATPLGAIETWPRALAAHVSLMLELPDPAIIFWGPEQTQIYNDGYAVIMGPRHPRYLGAAYRDCWPDTYPTIYPWMRRVLDRGETIRVERALIPVTRFGFDEDTYFTFTFSPLRDDDGRIAGIFQPVSEVTAGVLAQRRAETLRALVARADDEDPLANADAALRTNPGDLPHVRVYRRGEVAIAIGDVPEALAGVAAEADAAARHGDAFVVPLRQPTGERFGAVVVLPSPRLHFDEPYRSFLELVADRIGGAFIASEERRRHTAMQQAIEGALDEARRANRAKDEFLALLGHELRNPMAPIVTALELMELKGDAGVTSERLVIARQTGHLTRLVDDLLDVARIARGTYELHLAPTRLSEAIARAAETAAPLFAQRGHELRVDVPAELVGELDPDRIQQVFGNLLVNAAKFTPPGGRVHVDARRDGDELVIAVRDTGEGISAEILPRVFDMFVQERQGIERRRGGLGLGLAIVRAIVRRHGGEVTATSAGLGHGTTMEVRLPAAAGPIARARTKTPPSLRSSTGRVLVVDDNLDAAELLAAVLRTLGHQVEVVHDGGAAIAAAAAFRPDVALLDIGLPVMDGYAVARTLRADPATRAIHLVALTGYGQAADRAESQRAGFEEHLTKPVDIARVAATLEQLLA